MRDMGNLTGNEGVAPQKTERENFRHITAIGHFEQGTVLGYIAHKTRYGRPTVRLNERRLRNDVPGNGSAILSKRQCILHKSASNCSPV
jgi:hypothetical protein